MSKPKGALPVGVPLRHSVKTLQTAMQAELERANGEQPLDLTVQVAVRGTNGGVVQLTLNLSTRAESPPT